MTEFGASSSSDAMDAPEAMPGEEAASRAVVLYRPLMRSAARGRNGQSAGRGLRSNPFYHSALENAIPRENDAWSLVRHNPDSGKHRLAVVPYSERQKRAYLPSDSSSPPHVIPAPWFPLSSQTTPALSIPSMPDVTAVTPEPPEPSSASEDGDDCSAMDTRLI
jgi:hypothetical protein